MQLADPTGSSGIAVTIHDVDGKTEGHGRLYECVQYVKYPLAFCCMGNGVGGGGGGGNAPVHSVKI